MCKEIEFKCIIGCIHDVLVQLRQTKSLFGAVLNVIEKLITCFVMPLGPVIQMHRLPLASVWDMQSLPGREVFFQHSR